MKIKIILLQILLTPLQVFSWGSIGHSTVGVIAQSNLTPKARAGVQRLIGSANLSDVANWADSLKSTTDYKQAVWYHFEKMPDNYTYLENLKALPDWQQKKGGVVSAILVANDILRKQGAPLKEQADALKFLVHFVGDIHQPFHSGRPEDNGGVKIDTIWFGQAMSLHKIWDSGMIMTGHEDIVSMTLSVNEASRNYADYLARKYSSRTVNDSFDVESWLNESLDLRLEAYDPLYKTDQKKYQSLHMEEIDLRLYQAGLRLANMLNEIYAHQPTPRVETELWKNIEALVGKLENIVRLRP